MEGQDRTGGGEAQSLGREKKSLEGQDAGMNELMVGYSLGETWWGLHPPRLVETHATPPRPRQMQMQMQMRNGDTVQIRGG